MSPSSLALHMVANSPVNGRLIFVLATPESGAERVVTALAALPHLTTMGTPTHLFSQGIGALLDNWLSRTRAAFGDRADDTRFLADVRSLADAAFDVRRTRDGAERVVEYSPEHIGLVGPMMALYPDAHFVHLVRDGRAVVAQLASPLSRWAPFDAARRWTDDQLAVLAMGEHANLHVARVEDLLDHPVDVLGVLAGQLGIGADAASLAAAAALVGGRGDDRLDGRASTLIDVLAGEVLQAFGYDTRTVSGVDRGLARLQLGAVGEVAWAARGALRRARAAWREDGDG